MYKTLLLSLLTLVPIAVNAAGETPIQFITLGTAGGPQVINRSQPANALVYGSDVYLVDAGDGAATQLARAGVSLTRVKGLFLSHLHFDHTGGVLAVLGLRAMMGLDSPLPVYGPAGSRLFIDGLLAAMSPALDAGYGLPGQSWRSNPDVHEFSDGERIEFGGMYVTAVKNTHYQLAPDHASAEGSTSLSFRFDTPDRSIVYTGDTGPSQAVTELAAGADLLVTEMMDAPVVLANVRRSNPALDENVLAGLERHFTMQHVSPVQVAQLAAAAKVKSVVVTHFMPGASSQEQIDYYRSVMLPYYDGDIRFAGDLDSY